VENACGEKRQTEMTGNQLEGQCAMVGGPFHLRKNTDTRVRECRLHGSTSKKGAKGVRKNLGKFLADRYELEGLRQRVKGMAF